MHGDEIVFETQTKLTMHIIFISCKYIFIFLFCVNPEVRASEG